ncbi:MAG: hypothetical protein WD995_12095 [Gemmatimonadota bacterium]
MHLLLTDRLACPRCGPDFGLILLAERMEDRRVLEGSFGCPNCRDAFPVTAGFGDLRAPPRRVVPEGLAGSPGAEPSDAADAERILALLGIAQGPGTLALVGRPARHANALAVAIEGIHVVAIDPDLDAWPGASGVSRMMAAPGLPFFSRSLRGVAVDGRLGSDLVREAARVVARLGRVVVVQAADGVDAILEEVGLEILASEATTVVAARG